MFNFNIEDYISTGVKKAIENKENSYITYVKPFKKLKDRIKKMFPDKDFQIEEETESNLKYWVIIW